MGSKAPRRCAAARWATSSSPARRRGHRSGRAEVTLTIDNSDNALADRVLGGVDHPTDVPRRRRRIRDQRQHVAALMDVQELLSDSGIGREMHVIVGQGKPRNPGITARGPACVHRGGGRVLKHRKRKEKAVRKLDSMSATSPADRPDHRTAPPAQAARQTGRDGAPRPDHPGRPARRTIAAGRRRPGHPQGEFDDTSQAETTLRREHGRRAHRAAGRPGTRTRRRTRAACVGPHRASRAAQQRWFRLRPWPSGSTRRCGSPASAPSTSTPNPTSPVRPRSDADAQADEVAEQERQLLVELAGIPGPG